MTKLQQRQVVEVIGQQHAWSVGPLPARQKLLHPFGLFCAAVERTMRRQPTARAQHMAKSQL
jgi:hypothetical protein